MLLNNHVVYEIKKRYTLQIIQFIPYLVRVWGEDIVYNIANGGRGGGGGGGGNLLRGLYQLLQPHLLQHPSKRLNMKNNKIFVFIKFRK